MSDYNKINIRLENKGLNLVHSPVTLQFGEWTTFKNTWSEYEGEVTSARGFSVMSSTAAGNHILNIRRLQDNINSLSTYFCKALDGKVYASMDAASSGNATTTSPFHLVDTGATGLSSAFSSFVVERSAIGPAMFCYMGDSTKMQKFGIESDGDIVVKNMGVTRPVGPPTFSLQAGGSLTANSTYQYRYTLLDKTTGAESLYNSTAGSSQTTTSNRTIRVTIPSESVDSATSHVRIYRYGGTLTSWKKISDDGASFAYTGTGFNYDDAASDLSIASASELDEFSNKPFSIVQTNGTTSVAQPLKYLFGPFLGHILAVGDPLNPGFLYWTNKFDPDRQDPANNIEVSSPQDPLQNGFIYNNLGYVFSKEALYVVYPTQDENVFTPSKTACSHGLWTPTAFCVGPTIYFLSKDGIYVTDGDQDRCITDDQLKPIFDPDQSATSVNGIGCVDYTNANMFMAYYKNEVWFTYQGRDSSTHTLIFDVVRNRWRHRQAVAAKAMYSDEQTTANLIMGGTNGHLYQDTGTADAGSAISCEIETGLIVLGAPLIHKEFGMLVVDLNPKGATVTIKTYKDKGGTLITTTTSNSATRTRVTCNIGDYAEDLSIEFTWSSSTVAPIIYGYELFYRNDEPQLNRWSVTGTNHGILGWQILRSGYFTLRSDGQVVLTITSVLDGSTSATTYNIATTSGVKRKIFIPFDPIKGKLFNYSLVADSGVNFRFYPSESEIHVKPWISSFGYSIANPFVGGQQLAIGPNGPEAENEE